MADYYFDVWKDDFGNLNLKIPPKLQGQCQEEFRNCGQRGLLVYYAVFALQSRLDQLEKRLISVESIPRVTEIASATDTVNGVQPPLSPLKRMGRADLCRFGYRPDPRNNAKLLPDKEEQATIRRAQHLRSFGLSLREVCRTLDQEGRARRGKKWDGSQSVLRAILRREASSQA